MNTNKNHEDHNASFQYIPNRQKPSNLNKQKNTSNARSCKTGNKSNTNMCIICEYVLDGSEEELPCCGLKFHTTCIRYYYLG